MKPNRDRIRKAAAIARDVFQHTIRAPDDDPLALELRGPLLYLGGRAAQGIAPRLGMPTDGDTVADIVAYLTEGYASMVVEFDFEHFSRWRRQRDELAGLQGQCAGCRRPLAEHEQRDGMRYCADGMLAVDPAVRLHDEEPDAGSA